MTTVTGGLITLEYALQGLGYGAPQPGSARDADLVAYIQAATPVIERLCGPVLARSVTQLRDGGKSGVSLDGAIADAAAITAVRADGDSWTGHVVDPSTGILYAGGGRTFPAGSRNIEVDVNVGYATVPQALQLATRELVRHWVQIGKQSPAAGVLNLQADVASGPTDDYAIPRRVYQLCSPYMSAGIA